MTRTRAKITLEIPDRPDKDFIELTPFYGCIHTILRQERLHGGLVLECNGAYLLLLINPVTIAGNDRIRCL